MATLLQASLLYSLDTVQEASLAGWAGIAQLVEHKLPKLGVAGSRPVARSK